MKNPAADLSEDLRTVPLSRAILAQAVKIAPSLKPGVAVIEMAAVGQPEACEIVSAWRFNHPIRTMPRAEYAAWVERGTVTFHG